MRQFKEPHLGLFWFIIKNVHYLCGMRKIDSIVIHCYGKGTDKPKFDNVDCCRDWHTLPKPRGNGWSDIGYHYIITKDGAVHSCRPEAKKGAHCPKMNSRSIGICFTGDKKFTE